VKSETETTDEEMKSGCGVGFILFCIFFFFRFFLWGGSGQQMFYRLYFLFLRLLSWKNERRLI